MREELLRDLQKVKEQEDKLDRFFYDLHGNYSIDKVKKEFGSWTKAVNKLNASDTSENQKNPRGKGVSEEELLSDIRRAARASSLPFTVDKYEQEGTYSRGTIRRNIGSWDDAKKQADIKEIEKEKAGEMCAWLTEKLGIKRGICEDCKKNIGYSEKTVDDRIVLGAFYCAVRENDIPYAMRHISEEIPGREKQDIYDAYRHISSNRDEFLPRISVESFARRFLEELDISDEIARKVRERADNLVAGSSAPSSLAASLIYMTVNDEGEELTQERIADLANITKTTLRENNKKLEDKVDF